MTKISPALLAAYHTTHYQVELPDDVVTLRIGEFSSRLKELHNTQNVHCSAFVTAWNPYSAETPLQENHVAHAALEQELNDLHVPFWKGQGVDPASNPPGEKSVLAVGLDREAAVALGNKYRQNALVWAGDDAIPELVFIEVM